MGRKAAQNMASSNPRSDSKLPTQWRDEIYKRIVGKVSKIAGEQDLLTLGRQCFNEAESTPRSWRPEVLVLQKWQTYTQRSQVERFHDQSFAQQQSDIARSDSSYKVQPSASPPAQPSTTWQDEVSSRFTQKIRQIADGSTYSEPAATIGSARSTARSSAASSYRQLEMLKHKVARRAEAVEATTQRYDALQQRKQLVDNQLAAQMPKASRLSKGPEETNPETETLQPSASPPAQSSTAWRDEVSSRFTQKVRQIAAGTYSKPVAAIGSVGSKEQIALSPASSSYKLQPSASPPAQPSTTWRDEVSSQFTQKIRQIADGSTYSEPAATIGSARSTARSSAASSYRQLEMLKHKVARRAEAVEATTQRYDALQQRKQLVDN